MKISNARCASFVLVVTVFVLAKTPCARAQETKAWPLLNNDQRRIAEWTTRQFRGFFDNRSFVGWSKEEREALEAKTLDALKGPRAREYYQAINTLGALRTTNALKPLLAIATDRADKDNRDRWMAIRALGQFDQPAIIPELIPLVYHGNVNTRWWAQISLVQLSGTNFGGDWRSWGAWWNAGGGKPLVDTNSFVRWSHDPAWATPESAAATNRTSDANFLSKLPPASR